MRLSERGHEKLKHFEGLRLTAYMDVAGVWTIGFGHTGGVRPGTRISHEEAEAMYYRDVMVAERCVRTKVTVTINQNQFDALVSFVFNVGCGAFGRSTLLRHLNQGDHPTASKEFTRWNRAGGRVVRGLKVRREAEQMLFREEVEV